MAIENNLPYNQGDLGVFFAKRSRDTEMPQPIPHLESASENDDNGVASFLRANEVVVSDARESLDDKPEFSWRKTTMRTIGGVAIVAGVFTLWNGAEGIAGFIDGMTPKIKTAMGTTDGGKGVIEEVSTKMPPITLGTAKTEVTKEKTTFQTNAVWGPIKFNIDSQTIETKSEVDTFLNVDPGKVKFSYDASKERLVISADSTAITTRVEVPANGLSVTDNGGGPLSIPEGDLAGLSKAIGSMFGTGGNEVPLLGEIDKGTESEQNVLRQFASDFAAEEVDQQCTPKIQAIKGFMAQIKQNIITATIGRLLTDPKLAPILTAMGKNAQKDVKNAVVELPSDFKIGPDPNAKKAIDNYKKSGILMPAGKQVPFTCGTDKDTKLELVNGESN